MSLLTQFALLSTAQDVAAYAVRHIHRCGYQCWVIVNRCGPALNVGDRVLFQLIPLYSSEGLEVGACQLCGHLFWTSDIILEVVSAHVPLDSLILADRCAVCHLVKHYRVVSTFRSPLSLEWQIDLIVVLSPVGSFRQWNLNYLDSSSSDVLSDDRVSRFISCDRCVKIQCWILWLAFWRILPVSLIAAKDCS